MVIGQPPGSGRRFLAGPGAPARAISSGRGVAMGGRWFRPDSALGGERRRAGKPAPPTSPAPIAPRTTRDRRQGCPIAFRP